MWSNGELSLAYLTVNGASPLEHVEAAAAAGYVAAGLRILPPSHLPESRAIVGDTAASKALRQRCEALGVTPLDAEVMSICSTTRDDELNAMVATASDLQFRFVQTVVEDSNANRAAHNLARLAELAAQAGMGVALEFMAFRALNTLDSAVAMIERTGANNIGLIIDALHLARSGGSPRDVAAIDDHKIALAQFCDAPLASPPNEALADEARWRRLQPGEGELWLDELLDVLPDGVPISLEVPNETLDKHNYADRAQLTKSAFERLLLRRANGKDRAPNGS